jgi:hypothetical protein
MTITFSRRETQLTRSKGLSCLQTVVPADATGEYVRVGESTTLESLRRFVKAVIEVFGDEYLRSPNENDIARLLALGA